jgi:hypothetical protein
MDPKMFSFESDIIAPFFIGPRTKRKSQENPFMVRKAFFSFHYDDDCWRTQRIRNIGFIDASKPASANDWENVKKDGDDAVEKWITSQLEGRSCTVVLVGAETANRKWVRR